MSMNNDSANIYGSQRLTISLPGLVYSQLLRVTAPRKVSQFVARAVSEKVSEVIQKISSDPWEEIFKARNLVTKVNRNITVKEAINIGRA